MIRDDLVLHVEAALLAAGRPVAADELVAMFEGREDAPDRNAIRDAVAALSERWHGHSLEVSEVASGFRAQIRKEFSRTISALWQERPARYSRALLETLALIAYRQPISRGEIEEVRGVGISSSIMKTLVEREWVRVIGHREVPGRPALYGTTKHFLDAFNLKNLAALPPLAELRGLEDPPLDLFTGIAENPAVGEDLVAAEDPVVGEDPDAEEDPAVGEDLVAAVDPMAGEGPATEDDPAVGEDLGAAVDPAAGEDPAAEGDPEPPETSTGVEAQADGADGGERTD